MSNNIEFLSFIYFFVCCVYISMGDNLLLVDSPAPSARTSVLPVRHANRDQALLEQADSPCGVDKLLIFSPSKIAEAQVL